MTPNKSQLEAPFHEAPLYNDTLSGSSGFLPSMPTVGKRMPEMFHDIGLSDSSKTNVDTKSASTTSGKQNRRSHA